MTPLFGSWLNEFLWSLVAIPGLYLLAGWFHTLVVVVAKYGAKDSTGCFGTLFAVIFTMIFRVLQIGSLLAVGAFLVFFGVSLYHLVAG